MKYLVFVRLIIPADIEKHAVKPETCYNSLQNIALNVTKTFIFQKTFGILLEIFMGFANTK